MIAFPKPYADRVARLRAPLGLVLLVLFAWFAQPSPRSLAFGLPIAILGLLLRAWATGHLEKDARLADSGPYAFVRNPLYLGTLLAAAGFIVGCRRWQLAILFAAVFIFVYLPAIGLEEQHLRDLFPEFVGYAKGVPALWPTLRPLRTNRRFRWDLYKRHREYQALLAFLAVTALLIAKVLVPGIP
jgi:protein-S-isoprenylcysteine O-methyltransferase Ste14